MGQCQNNGSSREREREIERESKLSGEEEEKNEGGCSLTRLFPHP